ncbi:MAG TPA: DMT family transporter [Acidimicrobiales bacterium]|nr:DMT family transporter [Acidimicrobiales bacterium]
MILHHLVVASAALGAASCFAVSNVIEQRKAAQAPLQPSLGIALLWHLAHQPIWWLAIAVDFGGFGLQLLALGLGEVVFVQPLLVTSLLLSLVIGAVAGSHRLSRADLGWALVFAVSLSLFLVAARPSDGVALRPIGAWIPVFVVSGLLVIGCVLVSRRPARRAVALAAAAGLLFGVSSTLMKGFAHQVAHDRFGLFAHWQVYAMAAALAAGFLMMQTAFHAGDLRSSLPAVELGEPLVASTLGVVLLHEHLHVNSAAAGVLLTVTIVAMVASTIRLAQSTAAAKAEIASRAPDRRGAAFHGPPRSEVLRQGTDRNH